MRTQLPTTVRTQSCARHGLWVRRQLRFEFLAQYRCKAFVDIVSIYLLKVVSRQTVGRLIDSVEFRATRRRQIRATGGRGARTIWVSDPGDGGQASFRSPLASPSAWRRRRLEIASTGLRFRGSTWEWRHSFDIITCPGPSPRVSEWLKSRCSGLPPRVSERLKSRCPGASQRMFEWLKPRCPGPHATLLLCLISDIRTQRNAEPPLPSPCSGHPLPRHPSSFGFPSGIIR